MTTTAYPWECSFCHRKSLWWAIFPQMLLWHMEKAWNYSNQRPGCIKGNGVSSGRSSNGPGETGDASEAKHG